MIEICSGDMLDSEVEAIVCTVNTKGAMGKGLALACARRFDGLLDHYAKACVKGDVRVGEMWNYPTGLILGPRLVICFPTKKHWAHPSRIQWIESGLTSLVETIEAENLESVAVPALGCGHGGLEWATVEGLIRDALEPIGARVLVYPPA